MQSVASTKSPQSRFAQKLTPGGHDFEGPGGGVAVPYRRPALLGLVALVLVISGCQKDPAEHARSLLVAGQYQQAVDFLHTELEQAPSEMDLVQLYGVALLRNAQPSLAVWPLRRAYHEQGLKGSALVPLVEALTRGGAPAEAIELATLGLEDDPTNLPLLQMRSGANLTALRHDAALADVERLIERDPENLRYQETRANIFLKMKRLDEAAEGILAIAAKVAADPSLPPSIKARTCGNAAKFLQEKGTFDEAAIALEACLALYPGYPEVIYPYIEHLEETGQADRVLDLLLEQAGAEEAKGRLIVQSLLAAQLRGLGRIDEATEVLRKTAEFLEAPQGWLELATHYVEIDDMAAAADAVGRAVAIVTGGEVGYGLMQEQFAILAAQGDEDLLFAFADILVQAERIDEARKILPHLEEPVHKLLIEARLAMAEGDPRLALERWDEAFMLWPANAGARYLAAGAAMEIGEFDRAAALFQDSLRADPTFTDAGIILGRMQLLRGAPEAAFHTLNIYLMKNPSDLEAMRLIIRSVVMVRAPDSLLGVAGAFDAAGYSEQGLTEYALGLEVLRGADEAVKLLDAEEELDSPRFFLALANWARMTHGQGEPQKALERVQKAAERHPASGRLEAARGMTLALSAESQKEAGAAFKRAIELEPDLPEARVLLARWLSDRGDNEAAASEYDRAATLEPKESSHAYEAAVALLAAGQEEEGERRLRAVLKQYPWHGDSAAWLAKFALERDDSGPETLALARRGSSFGEALTPSAFETLGLVRLARGEFPESAVALRWAIALQENPARSHYHLAQVLVASEQPERAVEQLNTALGLDEDFAFAAQARAQLTDLALPASAPEGGE